MELKEFLSKLSESAGVTGHEGEVGKLIRELMGGLADDVSVDKLGNCVFVKRGEGQGSRPRVMLAGHMDEIGLVVTKLEDGGFLRFTQMGGVDQRILPAMEVTVHGKRALHGVIGGKPPHIISPEEAAKATKMEDLFIDVGLSTEQLRETVSVGDMITFHRPFTELTGGFAAGKSLDDRAGVAVIYACLCELKKLRHTADVYGVATVQEEVGLRGAMVSAYSIDPDLAVAIDVCQGDTAGVPEWRTAALDKGPAVCMGANIHPKVHTALVKTARDIGITYQDEVAAGPTGTDAWAIQVSRAGVPTGLISIPLRYMHTSVETLSLGDVKNAGRLLAYFIAGVDQAFVEGLACY